MSLITDYLPWALWRRHRLRHTIEGFTAHPVSYADAKCRFDVGSKVHRGACLFDTQLGIASYTSARMVRARVGRFCSIGRADIGGHGRHPVDWLSTHPAFYSNGRESGLRFLEESIFDGSPEPVAIGNDVWIGHGARVMPGCTIGDGAIVATGAVVTKTIEPYAIVGGVPAKLIRHRFEPSVVAALLDWRWWNLPLPVLRRVARKFTDRVEWSEEDISDLRRMCELQNPEKCPHQVKP